MIITIENIKIMLCMKKLLLQKREEFSYFDAVSVVDSGVKEMVTR